MSLVEYAVKAAKAIERTGLRYALVGGLACILMGVRRMTEDADFIVEARTLEDVERLAAELRREGIPVVEREVRSAYYDRGHFTAVIGGLRLDFKFASSRIDHETVERAVSVEVMGAKLRIGRLEENIAVKLLLLRSLKDLEDALWLMAEHGAVIDWRRLRSLVGGDPLKLAETLLDDIEAEFRDEEHVLERVRELRSRLGAIRP